MHEEYFVNIHSHRKPQLENEITLRNSYHYSTKSSQRSFYSSGIHPFYADLNGNKLGMLRANLTVENYIAIGEIGIDRVCSVPLEKQFLVFETQFNLAQELNIPIIIHAVRSYSDLLPYLKKSKVPFIFHHYSGNVSQTSEFLKWNCYFSFGKDLLFNKFRISQQLKNIPLQRIFLETDQLPISIDVVYKAAQELTGFTMMELKQQLLANFQFVFPNAEWLGQ